MSVRDSASAGDLIRRLLDEFAAESVLFDAEHRKVCVESDGSGDRALVKALDVVEEWVTASEGAPTTVEVDGHVYSMGPSAPVGGVR